MHSITPSRRVPDALLHVLQPTASLSIIIAASPLLSHHPHNPSHIQSKQRQYKTELSLQVEDRRKVFR